MRVVLTEACGIEHEVDAVLTGVTKDGDLYYVATFDVHPDTLRYATVYATAMPTTALLEIRSNPVS